MAYQFPSNPTAGDTYDKFTWSGAAWTITPTGLSGDITDLNGPTGADGVPSAYNLVVVDKDTGEVKVIPDYDYIQPE